MEPMMTIQKVKIMLQWIQSIAHVRVMTRSHYKGLANAEGSKPNAHQQMMKCHINTRIYDKASTRLPKGA